MSNTQITTPAFWLQEAGYVTYLVGNQVRDPLLGIATDSRDVDMATTALPEEVVAVLRKNNVVPKIVDDKFGVVSFAFEGYNFEATTLRQDIYATPNSGKRYPDTIKFVSLVAYDAPRRDFTINAIYLNPKTGEQFDYHEGMSDIATKTLRVIGDPAIRFGEDPLRILRAVRLRHQLGLSYDRATKAAIAKHASLVRTLSRGVITKELSKLQAIPAFSKAQKELIALGLGDIL